MNFTPDNIDFLEPHQIVIVGTNTEGRHGKGFALVCKQKWGLKQGHKRGLSGQCYAIVTKDLAIGYRSVSLKYIQKQLLLLYAFAGANPNNEFLLTKIGTNHAGYTEKELQKILEEIEVARPMNIILPKFN